jgi:hypothetical protein
LPGPHHASGPRAHAIEARAMVREPRGGLGRCVAHSFATPFPLHAVRGADATWRERYQAGADSARRPIRYPNGRPAAVWSIRSVPSSIATDVSSGCDRSASVARSRRPLPQADTAASAQRGDGCACRRRCGGCPARYACGSSGDAACGAGCDGLGEPPPLAVDRSALHHLHSGSRGRGIARGCRLPPRAASRWSVATARCHGEVSRDHARANSGALQNLMRRRL